jgi:predicted transcriptional regulator
MIMREVLISIQPKWCELIASGKKTVEVRKTRPKIDTPFRCYIYMTAGNAVYPVTINGAPYTCSNVGGKVVIGEFMCYGIEELYQCNSGWVSEYACIPQKEFFDYLGIPQGTHLGYEKTAYGWHIDDLVIYDKPKELSEFKHWKKFDWWDYGHHKNKPQWELRSLSRPPQSWCYVEEVKSDDKR